MSAQKHKHDPITMRGSALHFAGYRLPKDEKLDPERYYRLCRKCGELLR